MAEHDWDDHYVQGFTPWDTETPDAALVDWVSRVGPTRGRVLDIGCGTGVHALWLSAQGFDVIGIDVSPRAIERAEGRRSNATIAGSIRFVVHDFLAAPPAGGPFDLIFDRGVFHVFDAPDERARFAEHVAHCLAPSGQWLSLIGSCEGPPRDQGPPRRSARDITNAIEPVLEIVELRSTAFDLDRLVQPRAWVCISRLRDTTAPRVDVQIRAERSGDERDIWHVTKSAFAGRPYADGTEQDVIDRLRGQGALAVSLVAEHGGRIIGHVAFSPAAPDDLSVGWYTLGPVAVDPDFQRQGVGRAIIHAGIRRLRELDAAGCIVLGDTNYYSRFGFFKAPDRSPIAEYAEHFMLLTLTGQTPTGKIGFHKAFEPEG